MAKKNVTPAPIRTDLDLAVPPVLITLDTSVKTARRQGRRDWRMPIEEDGHTHWTHLTHENLREKAMLVSESLHDQTAAIDREILACIQELKHLKATPPSEPSASAGNPEFTRVQDLRAQRAFQAMEKGHSQRIDELHQRIAALTTNRSHIHDQARSVITQIDSTFRALAAAHRLGQDRAPWFFRWRKRSTTPVPSFNPGPIPWMDGDLPMMTTEIDPSTATVLGWSYNHFTHSPAAPNLVE